MNTISQTYLKEALDYNPDTGIFVWRARPINHFKTSRGFNIFNAVYAHKAAGCIDKFHGYLQITIDGKLYPAHRLVWAYVHGEFPVNDIDHISHDRSDNRISNLREATRAQNTRNQTMRKTNKSGFNGVSWAKTKGKYVAQIRTNGKAVHLGQFSDIKDAIAARQAANIKFGYHKNHGASS